MATKVYQISTIVFLDLFRTDNKLNGIKVLKGFPKDAELVGIRQDPSRDYIIEVIIASEAFDNNDEYGDIIMQQES